MPEIFERFYRGDHGTDIHGQKQPDSIVHYYFIDQLILIFPVHLSAGISKIVLRHFRTLIRKILQCLQCFLPGTGIDYRNIQGALLNFGTDNILLSVQIVLQCICLRKAHAALQNVNPESPLYLMFDHKSHNLCLLS